jgi:hypothetical protein
MLLLHFYIRMTLGTERYLVRPIDRGTLVRDTKDAMASVTRGTGWSILITTLQGLAVIAPFEPEGCLPVTSAAIDTPKLLLVGHD